jgi:hypothetical protein
MEAIMPDQLKRYVMRTFFLDPTIEADLRQQERHIDMEKDDFHNAVIKAGLKALAAKKKKEIND